MTKRLIFLTIAVYGVTLPALANITYTCDATSFATYVPAGTNACAMLNGAQASGVYSGIFSNVTANIFIQFYNNGGVAESAVNLTGVPYGTYLAALASHSTDATALASLPGTDPFDPSANVAITPALASALGAATNPALAAAADAGTTTSDGVHFSSCSIVADPNCYSGVIVISTNPLDYPASPSDPPGTGLDFFYLVEHETDEVLGTVSCIGTDPSNLPFNQCNPGTADASPADLFRYSAPGTRSFLSTANGTPAYFSIDSGQTDIADYTNTPGLGDYGDWKLPGTFKVQTGEAEGGVNLDLTNDGGSEISVLNAVGFNLNSSVPEPGTLALLGVSLATLAALAARRSRQN